MTTPFPFTAGQVLTAAQMNAITTLPINDQTASYTLVVGDVGKRVIMNVASANTVTVNDSIFAAGDTIFIANKGAGVSTITAGAGVTINSASGLALVTSQSGQLVALSASSFLFVASAGISKVVQLATATKANSFSTTSATFVDVTDLSVAITPTLSNSTVLVIAHVQGSQSGGDGAFRLVRDATNIALSTAGSTTNGFSQVSSSYTNAMFSCSITFLDSPATTSATTYKVQAIAPAGTTFVNRRGVAADFGGFSSITVMEISA